MRILCIEDQEEKFKQIREATQKECMAVDWECNCQNGLMKLRSQQFDVVLLDMSMPICDDSEQETFDSYAGMYVLKEIKRRKYATKVIVITGFSDFEQGKKVITLSELDKEISEKYGSMYLGFVKYDSTTIEWQEKLIALIGLVKE